MRWTGVKHKDALVEANLPKKKQNASKWGAGDVAERDEHSILGFERGVVGKTVCAVPGVAAASSYEPIVV